MMIVIIWGSLNWGLSKTMGSILKWLFWMIWGYPQSRKPQGDRIIDE